MTLCSLFSYPKNKKMALLNLLVKLSVLLLFSVHIGCKSTGVRTPADFIKKIGSQISKNADIFYFWEYGGALIFDGLWQANQSFGFAFETQLNRYMDMFITDKGEYGFEILHNLTIPFGEAVGDTVGLFPICYLNRALSYSSKRPGYENSTDMFIVNNVADKYILQWPRRLPDGTFSRDKGWRGEKDRNASFLWGDDQYMGLTLLARLAASTNNLSMALITAEQIVNFAKYMRDPLDGLFFHGYNYADNKRSCCKWGRANGWGLMAHGEVLKSMEAFPSIMESSLYKQTLRMFKARCNAIAKVQSSDGRWHQVLNRSDTYLETTASAMFLSSIAKGVVHGWLDRDEFLPVLSRGWIGLNRAVQEDGTVTGCCIGTGILTSVEEYNERPTPYLASGGSGLGAVLYAGVDYAKILKSI